MIYINIIFIFKLLSSKFT